MIGKMFLGAVFLLSFNYSSAQDQYDTLTTLHYYYNNYDETSEPNSKYFPFREEIRNYNTRGQLTSLEVWQHIRGYEQLYIDYIETYTYGTSDLIKSMVVQKFPSGAKTLRTVETWDYTYSGNLLTQVKIVKYAQSEEERQSNESLAWAWRVFGGATTDNSGWTTVSRIKLEYDAQNRLIKKAFYQDFADKKPETLWMYHYDQKEFPDINSYFEEYGMLRRVYNYLYKEGRLQTFRDENKGGVLRIRTHDYVYYPAGQLERIKISESEMSTKKSANKSIYKESEKEKLVKEQIFQYKDGLLSSSEDRNLESYTVYKSSFLDRLAGLGSYQSSTSTIRYGDYQTSTTTTTVQPVTIDKSIKKTKRAWVSEKTIYEYDTNRRLTSKKVGFKSPEKYSYDSKGRIMIYEAYGYLLGKARGLVRIKGVYKYRN